MDFLNQPWAHLSFEDTFPVTTITVENYEMIWYSTRLPSFIVLKTNTKLHCLDNQQIVESNLTDEPGLHH